MLTHKIVDSNDQSLCYGTISKSAFGYKFFSSTNAKRDGRRWHKEAKYAVPQWAKKGIRDKSIIVVEVERSW